MSDTPRTDAEVGPAMGSTGVVFADFARTLERELTACREALANIIEYADENLARRAQEYGTYREDVTVRMRDEIAVARAIVDRAK